MATGEKPKEGIYSTANRVRLVPGGAPYFTLLEELIDNARYSIHLQVYIFNHDETGMAVAEALIRAARRGVKVFFMVDGYASQNLTRELHREFKEAGVYYEQFEPFFRNRSFYFGRRMHHKIMVADGFYSLVGGLNIADRYNDMPGIPAWLDYAVYAEGEVSFELSKLCCRMWNQNSIACKAVPGEQDLKMIEQIPHDERCSVRIRRNDWVKGKNQVWKSYFDMFNHAQEDIIIMCSYFLPGWVYRKRMEKAVSRGVKIKVVTAGKSDVMVAKYAEKYLYRWMLRNKIELYELRDRVLHAKIAVQDGKWMTIGSYNVNNISAYASVELNLDVRNRAFAGHVQATLEKVIAEDCVQITEEVYARSSNIFKKALYRISYEFIRVMLYLFTFYFKKEE